MSKCPTKVTYPVIFISTLKRAQQDRTRMVWRERRAACSNKDQTKYVRMFVFLWKISSSSHCLIGRFFLLSRASNVLPTKDLNEEKVKTNCFLPRKKRTMHTEEKSYNYQYKLLTLHTFDDLPQLSTTEESERNDNYLLEANGICKQRREFLFLFNFK